ncbi:hypothetical protein MHA_2192 [Mannheimia haemolytica PHL213]|nr:hypothetical protein MHA_2192 [Mannheimia haemolytica PHL213]
MELSFISPFLSLNRLILQLLIQNSKFRDLLNAAFLILANF